MTKFAYWIALVAAAVFVLFALLAAGVLGILPPVDTMWSNQHHVSQQNVRAWFNNYCYLFIVVCLIGQAIDTYYVLRQFAKKEKEALASVDE